MRRGLLTALLSTMVLIGSALPARADPGDPDPAFGGTGHVVASLAGSQDTVGIAVRTGGKVLVFEEHGAVAQFKADGDPDLNFGSAGVATAPAAGSVFAGALQEDGKLVLVGVMGDDFLVERLEADGDPDPTFGGGDGIVTTGFSQAADALAVFVQQDGKIVVTGENGADTYDFAIARYRPNGTLDPTFGGDGRVTTSMLGDEFAEDAAPGPNGTIVAVGETQVPESNPRFAIVRYLSNGHLDRSFSGDGKAVVNVDGDAAAHAVVVRSDGAIVVGGDYQHPDVDWALVRLQPNGKLDPAFGDQGKVRTIIGPARDLFADLIRQPNGKLVAAGVNDEPPFRLYLVRYRANGTLDAGFGTMGRIAEQLGDSTSTRQIANAPGSKVVVGATVEDGGEQDMAAARYLAD